MIRYIRNDIMSLLPVEAFAESGDLYRTIQCRHRLNCIFFHVYVPYFTASYENQTRNYCQTDR